jgi:hypothetical protein
MASAGQKHSGARRQLWQLSKHPLITVRRAKRKRLCSIWCVRWAKADIVEGLGKLEMLRALDDMRCDWMEILQHGLPELTPRQAPVREPHLVRVKKVEN